MGSSKMKAILSSSRLHGFASQKIIFIIKLCLRLVTVL
jgi:hypothetical protein